MGSDLMRTVYVQACIRFPLGKQGENEAMRVVWPGIVEKFRKLYGSGAFTLTAKRCGDAAAYPVAVSTEGEDVVWLVRAADVASPGSGSCELTYTVDGAVAKSQTWSTYVAASISGDAPGEPPEEPAKAWFAAIQAQIGNLDDLTTKAKASLVAAINEAAKTGSGGAGSISMRTADGYIQYSTDGGETWENLIAVADLKGDPGPQGEPGTPGKDGADGAPGKDGTDGANGITPTIGDNGNWYLGNTDTGKPSRGPAGQDGAPGKDGAGMDITGATVGQIAKISAVDTDGKPTAWEPADLPGGGSGETWEKIAEIELRTDTAEYVLADFATWRKAKVIMTRPKYISGLNKNVLCRVVGQDDAYTCGFLTIGYGYIFWEFSAEVNELFVLSSHIETNNRAAQANVTSTGTFTPLKSPVEKCKFKLLFADTSVIQAGDKVTVIGVRR
nr:MAG TPA: nucleoid-associated protein [Caudoviricetes sp.]